MPTSVSTTLTKCLAALNHIKTRAEQPDYRHEGDVPLASWITELSRLRVWTSNVWAYETGQSSLEDILGNTSPLTGRAVTDLLENLHLLLSDILGKLSRAAPSASGDDAPSTTSPEPTTELQQLYPEVVSSIDWLYVVFG
ncbi:hypothetical protein HO133_011072 [Letharia lupina]|uniref:Uncharacterized protein n=1 Tax=Letharia lupina TaxID=560253 RepID=A0A8H6FDM9_9LECA|nr:uncharacterized protein HO133_011072 [Letharia lupina]KAF6224495.1 hypothetical protein HO133_011072 [Letharia lupina]